VVKVLEGIVSGQFEAQSIPEKWAKEIVDPAMAELGISSKDMPKELFSSAVPGGRDPTRCFEILEQVLQLFTPMLKEFKEASRINSQRKELIAGINSQRKELIAEAKLQLKKKINFPRLTKPHPDAKKVISDNGILICFSFILTLNEHVFKDLVPYINLRNRSSYATRMFKKCRPLFLHVQKKLVQWKKLLTASARQPGPRPVTGDQLNVKINRFLAMKLREKAQRDTRGVSCFNQMFRQLYRANPAFIRSRADEQHRPWKVETIGEHADDYGGVYRDMIENMANELQSNTLDLFIPTPNTKHKVGNYQGCWLPNPALSTDKAAIERFEFLQGRY